MASPFSRGIVIGFVLAFLLMAIVQQLTNLNQNTAAVDETSSQVIIYYIKLLIRGDNSITEIIGD